MEMLGERDFFHPVAGRFFAVRSDLVNRKPGVRLLMSPKVKVVVKHAVSSTRWWCALHLVTLTLAVVVLWNLADHYFFK